MAELTANLPKDVALCDLPLISKGMLTIKDNKNQTLPVDLLMVLDVSTSMSGQGITVLTDSVVHTIQNLLRDQDRLAIITFESSASVHTPWISKTNTVSGFQSTGGTNFGAAINEVLSFLGASGRDHSRAGIVLFLSDGQAGMPNSDNVRMIPELGFTMHTIGVTNGVVPENLEQMAELANGTYHNAPTFSDVEAAFDSIFNLGETVIYAAPSLRVDVPKGVTISKIEQSPKALDIHSSDIVGPATESLTLPHMNQDKRLELTFMIKHENIAEGDNLLATFNCIGVSTELRVRGSRNESEVANAPVNKGIVFGTLLNQATGFLKTGNIDGATTIQTRIEALDVPESEDASTIIGTAIDADTTGEILDLVGKIERTNEGKTVLRED